MEFTIRDLMTCDPATVGPEATIDEAMTIVLAKDAAEIYVTDDDGRLQGVVPDYELLKSRMSHTAGDESIERLMSRNVATVHPDSPVDAAMAACRESCRRVIAVCEAGRLVGQISRRDVLRMMESLRSMDRVAANSSSANDIAEGSRTNRLSRAQASTRVLSLGR
jgi:CBS domain-containing protein